MVDITVYTVILNGFDNLRPPSVTEQNVRYVCFTDEPRHCPPWEMQPAWLRYPDDPHRNSRIPKILSHLHIDTEFSIYYDGSLRLQCRPSQLIADTMCDADWAMYRHPCRKSVYEEAEACKRMNIAYDETMQAQVDRYRAHGIDGLWAGGVVIRRRTDLTVAVEETWWKEFSAGCSRDQIAFPFARQSWGLHVHTIDEDILQDGRRFGFVWHGWDEQKGDNPSFAGRKDASRRRWERLRELCA
jgi:hypothetical protein